VVGARSGSRGSLRGAARAPVRPGAPRRVSLYEASRARHRRAAGHDSVVRAPRGGVPELVVECAGPPQGYIDWVFLPGFAVRYHARFPYVEPLLKGRSARVLYTQNAPWLAGWLFRGDLFWLWISRPVLRHCGFRPVRRHALYGAKNASPERRAAFLASVRELGRRGA
jgi:hypothetical protein